MAKHDPVAASKPLTLVAATTTWATVPPGTGPILFRLAVRQAALHFRVSNPGPPPPTVAAGQGWRRGT
jgi:hypothetical protein